MTISPSVLKSGSDGNGDGGLGKPSFSDEREPRDTRRTADALFGALGQISGMGSMGGVEGTICGVATAAEAGDGVLGGDSSGDDDDGEGGEMEIVMGNRDSDRGGDRDSGGNDSGDGERGGRRDTAGDSSGAVGENGIGVPGRTMGSDGVERPLWYALRIRAQRSFREGRPSPVKTVLVLRRAKGDEECSSPSSAIAAESDVFEEPRPARNFDVASARDSKCWSCCRIWAPLSGVGAWVCRLLLVVLGDMMFVWFCLCGFLKQGWFLLI